MVQKLCFTVCAPAQAQIIEGDDMACQSDDESGIMRALAMSAPQKTEDSGELKSERMNEALKLREKMNPSMRRHVQIISPRKISRMFEDNEEEEEEDDKVSGEMRSGVENDEPNVGDGVQSGGRGGRGGRRNRMGGRSALLARLNLKNEIAQKEEKEQISSSQFQNQLSSRFKTTKHQVRRLASSDNED